MTGLNPSLPSNVPLILKASCDERLKRIRFPPDLSSLQYPDFRTKVAGALQFEDVDFTITWEDDDGEHVSIGHWKWCARVIEADITALISARLQAQRTFRRPCCITSPLIQKQLQAPFRCGSPSASTQV